VVAEGGDKPQYRHDPAEWQPRPGDRIAGIDVDLAAGSLDDRAWPLVQSVVAYVARTRRVDEVTAANILQGWLIDERIRWRPIWPQPYPPDFWRVMWPDPGLGAVGPYGEVPVELCAEDVFNPRPPTAEIVTDRSPSRPVTATEAVPIVAVSPPDCPATDRSGAPGAPSSAHLALHELERRWNVGEIPASASLASLARDLSRG